MYGPGVSLVFLGVAVVRVSINKLIATFAPFVCKPSQESGAATPGDSNSQTPSTRNRKVPGSRTTSFLQKHLWHMGEGGMAGTPLSDKAPNLKNADPNRMLESSLRQILLPEQGREDSIRAHGIADNARIVWQDLVLCKGSCTSYPTFQALKTPNPAH